MPKKEQTSTIRFDDRKKELTKRTHVTEIFNKRELYNIYGNLSNQLENYEKAVEKIKEDLKELEPHFIKIKNEVEKEIEKEKREKSA